MIILNRGAQKKKAQSELYKSSYVFVHTCSRVTTGSGVNNALPYTDFIIVYL